MAFEDRAEAGRLLAQRLEKYRGRRPLVLAIPRGAVPMGKIVADLLDGELDVVLVRKLRAPFNPELAIGSIDEMGAVYLDPAARDLWDKAYLEAEKKAQLETLRTRRQQYAPTGAPIDAAGRVAIVLDDGIATGSTMIAALRAVRSRHPAELIAATGVAFARGTPFPPTIVSRIIEPKAGTTTAGSSGALCRQRPSIGLTIVSVHGAATGPRASGPPRWRARSGRREDHSDR
jgi:predicted phosphoribosyltransferase